jgi:hypothetical protein
MLDLAPDPERLRDVVQLRGRKAHLANGLVNVDIRRRLWVVDAEQRELPAHLFHVEVFVVEPRTASA